MTLIKGHFVIADTQGFFFPPGPSNAEIMKVSLMLKGLRICHPNANLLY